MRQRIGPLWDDMLQMLDIVLAQNNIRLVFLPKYSPELNPCETLWAMVKNRLRAWRVSGLPWDIQILSYLNAVTFEEVYNAYCHCIFNFEDEI